MSQIDDALTLDEVYDTLFSLVKSGLIENLNRTFSYIYGSRYRLITDFNFSIKDSSTKGKAFDGVIFEPSDYPNAHNVSALKFNVFTLKDTEEDNLPNSVQIASKFIYDMTETEIILASYPGNNHGFVVFISDNYDLVISVAAQVSQTLNRERDTSENKCEKENHTFSKNKMYVLVCMTSYTNKNNFVNNNVSHLELRSMEISSD